MDRNNMRASYVSSGPRSLPHLGKRHSNGHSHSARLSPPAPPHNTSQQDDIINYIYESWNKISLELERGGAAARYYSEAPTRQVAAFRPFNLDEWWGRRLLHGLGRKPRC